MSNEQPITQNGFVTIESNYEYFINSKIGNLLQFQADFTKGDWTRKELKIIADELEETAKFFAREQGLDRDITYITKSGSLYDVSTHNTGKLYDSIKGRLSTVKNVVTLKADAKNSRNQYYAGFLEYGFHDRGGNFIPARPFLRPALYAVSEASKGHITSVLKDLLERVWTEDGYQGWKNITSFGRMRTLSGGLAKFYNNETPGLYTRKFFEKQSLASTTNSRAQIRNGRLGNRDGKNLSLDRYVNSRNADKYFKTKTFNYKPVTTRKGMFGDPSRNKPKPKETKTYELSEFDKQRVAYNEKVIRKNVVKDVRNGKRITHEDAKLYLTEREHLEYWEKWQPTGQTYKKVRKVK